MGPGEKNPVKACVDGGQGGTDPSLDQLSPSTHRRLPMNARTTILALALASASISALATTSASAWSGPAHRQTPVYTPTGPVFTPTSAPVYAPSTAPANTPCDCEAPVAYVPPPVAAPCNCAAPAPVVIEKKVYIRVPVEKKVIVEVPVERKVFVPVEKKV